LLAKLSKIKCRELNKIENANVEEIKKAAAKLIILDSIALEAFSKAVSHCPCTKQHPSSPDCCCENNEINYCKCRRCNDIKKGIDTNIDVEVQAIE
jgi:hypothetical protein